MHFRLCLFESIFNSLLFYPEYGTLPSNESGWESSSDPCANATPPMLAATIRIAPSNMMMNFFFLHIFFTSFRKYSGILRLFYQPNTKILLRKSGK
jgi:hypothetical protein